MQNRTPSSLNLHPEIPASIGPFRILRLLGSGGRGSVYLAERTEQFSQQVAIKILHPHLFAGVADARIDREGQLLATLDHPGIVRLLNLGTSEGGLRYLVMEYVDGTPLDVYCDRNRLPLRRRIEVLLDILDAVEHAHRRLIVHADLKPGNMLVAADGKPRLLDFGVSTVLSKLGAGQHENPDEDGYTPLYASPEQRAGERLTVASDVYSLGMIARSLLSGTDPVATTGMIGKDSEGSGAGVVKALRRLSQDRDGREKLARIATIRMTSPAGLIAAIQGDLDSILGKALCSDPAGRFQSVQEMRDEFHRWLLGYPIQTRPANWLERKWKWVLRNQVATGLLSVCLLALVFSVAGVVRQAADAARKREIAQNRLHELVRLTDVLAGDLYDSVHGLQGGEAAQAALLDSAHRTIDKLAADDGQDEQLDLELAREYEKLARLELGRVPLTAEALSRCDDDLAREAALLSGFGRSDAEAGELRGRLNATRQLRDAAKSKLAR